MEAPAHIANRRGVAVEALTHLRRRHDLVDVLHARRPLSVLAPRLLKLRYNVCALLGLAREEQARKVAAGPEEAPLSLVARGSQQASRQCAVLVVATAKSLVRDARLEDAPWQPALAAPGGIGEPRPRWAAHVQGKVKVLLFLHLSSLQDGDLHVVLFSSPLLGLLEPTLL